MRLDRRLAGVAVLASFALVSAAPADDELDASDVESAEETGDDETQTGDKPGWWLITGSMVANPFFEKQVRIQTNHGHYVIDSGPYAYIRHPGYVGFVAVLLATPLLLASAWTLVPALIASALFVIRTALEDRMLQVELPG